MQKIITRLFSAVTKWEKLEFWPLWLFCLVKALWPKQMSASGQAIKTGRAVQMSAKKAFFILFVCLGQEAWSSLCYDAVQRAGAFQKIDRSEIRKIFSHTENYVNYNGQEGYLLFVKQSPNSNRMDYIFNLVSKELGEEFKKLGWREYQGSVGQFLRERDRILDRNGQPIAEYAGQSGQVLFVREHYAGDMLKAFLNVSASLSEAEFKRLGWREYQGSAGEFLRERDRILDGNGHPIKKYAGQSGQALFAREHYDGDMFKAFKNISASLSEAEFKRLGWREYQGSAGEFLRERDRILDGNGHPIAKYAGQSGQVLFAREHYAGDMLKAFLNISVSLSEAEFKRLGWREYQGSVGEFLRERDRILDGNGHPIKKYAGQSGQALFAKENYAGDMLKAFNNISVSLSEAEFKRLGWREYQGSVAEFERDNDRRAGVFQKVDRVEIRKIFSHPESYVKYKGQEGYLLFAKQTPNLNNMIYILQLVSQELGAKFKRLGWKAYRGSAEEFERERGRILDENGQPIAEYAGQSGQALFAKEHYAGAMQRTFQNISASLSKAEFKRLGWQMYQGSAEEFERERGRILDENGQPIKKYVGQSGQALFAREHHAGAMQKAFRNISASLSKVEFKRLGWQMYQGSAEEFERERGRILDENGELIEKYKGQSGQALFAKDHYAGYMFRAFRNISAVLAKAEFKKLGWQVYYQGLAANFKRERGRILDENGELIEKYKGQSGQALFAKDHYAGDMQKAFSNISAVLTKAEFKRLGWQAYRGSAEEFERERGRILNKNSYPIAKYAGQSGQALFAKEHYGGDMFKAFKNISAVLAKAEFKRLGWQTYRGSVEEFERERDRILNKNSYPIAKYAGQSGLVLFAREHYAGDMFKAFSNISAVLAKAEFKRLGWQAYRGSVEEFKRERDRILNKNGHPIAKYAGQSGQALFAKKYYAGDMFKAFLNISAVLAKAKFKRLGWKAYQGSAEEFERERDRILDENGELIEKYRGQSGLVLFAKEHYAGAMLKAFKNISAVLAKAEFKRLGWKAYQGSAEEFERERGRILDENGHPIAKYAGQSGQALFAKKYYAGDMLKAFLNISAVLGGAQIVKSLGLDWKYFIGSAFEYKRLAQLFEKNNRAEFQGEEGLERVAHEIFNGQRERAYRNVFTLRESLLGSREAFKDLSWPASAEQ